MPDNEHCKNCGRPLTEVPEPFNHEWYLPCLACGAKNLIAVRRITERQAAVEITGWRE